MKQTDHDLVIIGGGPAGLTAGLYAARSRLNVILVEKIVPGGQVLITDWIENYPGFTGISGPDLIEKMVEQTKQFDLAIESNEVLSMDLTGDSKKLQLYDREITTKSIVIATGASPRALDIGEDRFVGRGLSYCATCDAPFFKDKVVVAVGGGDTAIQESIYLTKFVKKVYVVHRRDELRAAKILQERAFENDKIEFVWNSVLTSIDGESGVESVRIKNVKTGEEKNMASDGCFIWIGILPNIGFVGAGLALDDAGFIVTDDHMQTSVPGVFAAGDIRNTPLRQIATAVGDGAIAAMSAEHYIENIKK
ncbi:MAG: thioredoxin-disulfide reductase [Proteobacteria bacterium]|nr:thioredoxin-disulfide reductase [Pseudomonadota bacterium]